MSDGPKKRPTILNLNGRPIPPREDPAIYETPAVMSIEDALHADIAELRGHFEEAKSVLQIHHTALQEVVALVNSLEDRTLRGRIRRFVAWWDLQRERGRLAGEEFRRRLGR